MTNIKQQIPSYNEISTIDEISIYTSEKKEILESINQISFTTSSELENLIQLFKKLDEKFNFIESLNLQSGAYSTKTLRTDISGILENIDDIFCEFLKNDTNEVSDKIIQLLEKTAQEKKLKINELCLLIEGDRVINGDYIYNSKN